MSLKQDAGIEYYVAPWALVGEELPIHFLIEPNFTFDAVEIERPSSISIQELLNVSSFSQIENVIRIDELMSRDYFGLIITYDNIFTDTSTVVPISVRFTLGKKTIREFNVIAKFFRPHISVISKPDSIILTNESDLNSLLKLRIGVSGFGRIRIAIDVEANCDTEVVIESYLRNALKQVIATYSKDEEIQPDDSRFGNKDWILHNTEVALRSTNMPESLRKEQLDKLREFLTNTKNSGKIIEDLSKAIENLFLDMLLFQFEKYPIDGVELSYGKPSLFTSRFGDSLTLRVRYWDTMGNEYDPILVPIRVDDKRIDKEPAQIPINIDWVREPFLIS